MSEKVLVIRREYFPEEWLSDPYSGMVDFDGLNKLTEHILWMDRGVAENDESVKQLIPYIVLRSMPEVKIAVYQRAGNEKRIHGLYSVGVGGHIDRADHKRGDALSQTIIRSAEREVKEELVGVKEPIVLTLKGVINEEVTKVGRTHFGVVFEMKVNEKPKAGEELKNMHWVSEGALKDYKMELWSEMALRLID